MSRPANKLRMYQVIWERLKRDKEVRVACIPEDQRMVRKAVWKEKDLDIGYKEEMSLERKKMRVLCERHPTYMVFKLVEQKLHVGVL